MKTSLGIKQVAQHLYIEMLVSSNSSLLNYVSMFCKCQVFIDTANFYLLYVGSGFTSSCRNLTLVSPSLSRTCALLLYVVFVILRPDIRGMPCCFLNCARAFCSPKEPWQSFLGNW